MRSLIKVLWVFAVGCFPLIGCNDVALEKSLLVQASTHADPLCDPGSCDFTALEGVEVCEAGTDNCVVTGPTGKATFVLPADREFAFTAQKDGYQPKLFADVSDWRSEAVWWVGLRSSERAAPWHEHLMSDYPIIDVGAVFVLLTRKFEGATLDLVDATGTRFYWVGLEPPPVFPENADLNLEATTSRGSGGFLDVVAPGVFQIELGGTADDCVPANAWPGDAKNRVRFPIREGHVTEIWVDCPLPP